MRTGVLLSIKPEYSQAIFSGKKAFEFRKAIFKEKSVNKVYVYESMPTGKVVGEFEIENIISKDPEDLWAETSDFSGITKEFFDEYFKDRCLGHSLKVKNAKKYQDPKSLEDMFNIKHPPQSFRYV